MTDLIYQWIDLFWIPVALLAAHKGHKLMAVGFILACAMTMRMQVELMESIGYATGFLPFFETPLFTRGIIVYGVVIGLHMIMSYYSPGSIRAVYLAASISLLFIGFLVSMLVMAI